MVIDVRKYREETAKKTTFVKDNSVFPFWNLKKGKNAEIQLIPWLDPVTHKFFTVKKLVPMKFVDPEDDSAFVYVNAPTIEMYELNVKCETLKPVRALYKEAEVLSKSGQSKQGEIVKKIAGEHWIKPTYYYQGFVNKSDFREDEENIPENPIRVFPFKKQAHTPIETALEKGDYGDSTPMGSYEVEDIKAYFDGSFPADMMSAFDCAEFRISVTAQGDYNNYSSSQFLPRMHRMPDEQLALILEYGMHDLRARLPERPSDEQFVIYAEMMKVSLDRAFGRDEGRWNPEWEEAGIKAWRPDTAASSEESDSQPAIAESGRATVSSAGVENIMKNRTTVKPAIVHDEDGVIDEDQPATTSAPNDVRSRVAALTAKHKAAAAR